MKKKSSKLLKGWRELNRKKKRVAGAAALFCLLLAAACYTLFIAPLQDKDRLVFKEATVERGKLTTGVSESGTLEFGIKEILYDLDLETEEEEGDEADDEEEEEEDSTPKYLKVEEVYVSPGLRIKAGDALIKFTGDSVSGVRRLLENALVSAKSDYSEAEAEYDLEVLAAKTDYDTKKVSQSYADSIYGYAKTTIENEISGLQIEISQRTVNTEVLIQKAAEAREDFEEAREDFEAAKATMEITEKDNTVNFMTVQTEYLSAQSKYQTAEKALEQAQENAEENVSQIERLKTQLAAVQGRKTIDGLDAGQSYRETVISGDSAEITYNAKLEGLREELDEAREAEKEAKENLDAFESLVGEDGILYADGNGIVTQVGYEAGDILKTKGVAVSYASPDDMTISVDVTQEDVISMFVGDKVEILFTAYPDTPYEGEILSIDTTATSRSSATISYTVAVGVKGDTEKLYGGMTADITFVTEAKEDVLYVSKKAVVEEDGKTYVYVDFVGGKKLQEVQTGLSGSQYTEIVSGLEEGDTVYIASRVSSDSEVGTDGQEAAPGDSEVGTDGQEAAPGEAGSAGSGFAMPDGMSAQPGSGDMQVPEDYSGMGTGVPSGGAAPSGNRGNE